MPTLPIRIVKIKETTLKVPLTANAATIQLKELVTHKGTQPEISDFGGLVVLIVKQGEQTEFIICDGITHNADGSTTLDIAASGRNLDGIYPYAGGATGLSFSVGADVIVGDDPYTVYLLTEAYTNSVSFAGAPDASVAVKGIVEIATDAEIDADEDVGATGARLAVSPDQLALSKYNDPLTFINNTLVGVVLPYAGAAAPSGFLLCDGAAVSRSTYAALFAVLGTSYGAGDGSTTFNVPDLRSSFPIGAGQRIRTMTFDGAADVDPSTDQITVASNDWMQTGQDLVLSGSSLPTGLSAGTYYVIRINATTIKLATTRDNAVAGTPVNITADGSGTCTLTQTLSSHTRGATGGEEAHTLVLAELAAHTHALTQFKTNTTAGNPRHDNTGNSTTSTATTDSAGGNAPHANLPPYTALNFIIKT